MGGFKKFMITNSRDGAVEAEENLEVSELME